MLLKLTSLGSAIGAIASRLVPLTWFDGKSAWGFLFVVSIFSLFLWYIDRYIEQRIVTPIREATAAFSKLQESTRKALSELEVAAESLTCTVGDQHNRVEALTGKIEATHEHISTSLKELLKRIPPPPPTS